MAAVKGWGCLSIFTVQAPRPRAPEPEPEPQPEPLPSLVAALLLPPSPPPPGRVLYCPARILRGTLAGSCVCALGWAGAWHWAIGPRHVGFCPVLPSDATPPRPWRPRAAPAIGSRRAGYSSVKSRSATALRYSIAFVPSESDELSLSIHRSPITDHHPSSLFDLRSLFSFSLSPSCVFCLLARRVLPACTLLRGARRDVLE